jgi:glutaredoxin-like protein
VIPLRDQELLRLRFQRDLPNRIRIDFFTQKRSSIIIPGRQECVFCEEAQTLMEEIGSLSERISLTVHDIGRAQSFSAELGVDKVPATVIRGQTNRPIRFFGLPSGAQFPGFIETLVDASRGAVDLLPDTVKQLRRLKSDINLQVLMTPACQYSPPVVRTATKLALQSVRIKVEIIEIAEFPALVRQYGVRSTPTTVIQEKIVLPGAIDEATLVQNLMRVAEGRPLSGGMRAGAATAFNPAPQAQQQQPRPIGSSGLVLPR